MFRSIGWFVFVCGVVKCRISVEGNVFGRMIFGVFEIVVGGFCW